METKPLLSHCSVDDCLEDHFVGLRAKDDFIELRFPAGFALSNDPRTLRRDSKRLLSLIEKYSKQSEDEKLLTNGAGKQAFSAMPVSAFFTIVEDYVSRGGYYNESEFEKKRSVRGKIDWRRTVRQVRPFFNESMEPIYNTFIVSTQKHSEDGLVSEIHRYCVYQSFKAVGWLFTNYIPREFGLPISKKAAIQVVNQALDRTNKDSNKRLFLAMLSVLENSEYMDGKRKSVSGTIFFEGVWENIIDSVFGIENKSDYYPQAIWDIDGLKNDLSCSPLEPDTIMLEGLDCFVLDAKYYKYGITGVSGKGFNLPGSQSVGKQIAYAEFAKQKTQGEVYNVFVMPFNSQKNPFGYTSKIKVIGSAKANWRENKKTYEEIYGVLIDTSYLIDLYYEGGDGAKIELANLIRERVKQAPMKASQ